MTHAGYAHDERRLKEANRVILLGVTGDGSSGDVAVSTEELNTTAVLAGSIWGRLLLAGALSVVRSWVSFQAERVREALLDSATEATEVDAARGIRCEISMEHRAHRSLLIQC